MAYSKKTESMITRIDWVFFILAMTSIPLWYFTSGPLLSVVILTSVDLLGFVLNFRKAYFRPFEEQLTFFVLMAICNLIAIMALEHYSLTTVLFSALTALACLIFIIMVVYRRRAGQFR